MAKTENQPDAVIAAPFGRIGIWVEQGKVTRIDLMAGAAALKDSRQPVVQRVRRQLLDYLKNGNHRFDLALDEQGTPFQKSVWRQLRRIPPGKTLSYKDVAEKLKTSPRAVGAACRANPIPLVTPCHRVVAKNALGGFMGKTTGAPMRMKEWLLEHERRS